MANLPGLRDANWGEILNGFLLTEHNADGTHAAGADVAFNWKVSGHTPVYVSTSSFRINGANHTGIYVRGLRVRMEDAGGTGYVATVLSSVYAGGNTTVTIDNTNCPADITTLKYGLVTPYGIYGAIPEIAYLAEWYLRLPNLYAVPGYAPSEGLVNTDTPVIKFSPTVDNKVRFAFRIPEKKHGIDMSRALVFHLKYGMETSVASKKVSMNITYRLNQAAPVSVEDEITVPNTTTWAIHNGVNLRIAAGAYITGQTVTGVLWRDIDGVAQNHTGAFCLLEDGFWVTNEA
ncbi:MAG TPA: hypothetical protein PKM59_02010 [Thermodesulfobacteriota bacterium]|nr:hypothetical protein [Thermodesulfobacteriota bacterium]HNU70588.1 hypothetical protein [Thermodesulfobacteriota bacterium]